MPQFPSSSYNKNQLRTSALLSVASELGFPKSIVPELVKSLNETLKKNYEYEKADFKIEQVILFMCSDIRRELWFGMQIYSDITRSIARAEKKLYQLEIGNVLFKPTLVQMFEISWDGLASQESSRIFYFARYSLSLILKLTS